MAATARMSIGSAFGAITNAADSVASIFGTTNKAIGMLDTFVSDAAKHQKMRSAANTGDFKRKLEQDKAMEDTQRKKTIREFIGNDQQIASDFQESLTHYKELLKDF